jgi:hypothetical protein
MRRTLGSVLWNVGFILLGLAMVKAPSFGKIFGAVSPILGVVDLIMISLFAVDSTSFAIFGFPTFIIFPMLFGWKVYKLSTAA